MEGAESVLLRASLAKIPGVACFVLDRAGRYVVFNRPHEDLVSVEAGRTPETGEAYVDLLADSGRACPMSEGCEVRVREHREALTRALEGEAATARLGSAFPVSVAFTPVEPSPGQIIGIVGVHDPLPAVHRPRRRTDDGGGEDVRAEMARLVDGVLNELNNLGVGLAEANEALGARRLSSGATDELLDAIRGRADRARRLTRALRSHVMPAPQAEVDIDALLSELEPQLRGTARASALVLEKGAPGRRVKGDREELEDVFGELVRNATEAQARRIVVRSRPTSAHGSALASREDLLVEVADDGEGMSEDRKERVFDVYLGSRKHGQGVGLTRVRSIVRGHGGVIGIDSAPGAGTRVTLRLPTVAPCSNGAGHDAEPKSQRPQLDVFVVDDAPEVRRVLGRVLRHGGHKVSEAEDGIDALEKLEARHEKPDVVVLDLMMPRMDGVETYRALRAQTTQLPILITSGYHPSSLGFLATDRWARFLAKPFSPSEVLTALDDLMNG